MKKPFLPFALPLIGEEEIAEVVDTLRSGWLTTGPKAKRFEADFAQFVQMPHAIAVNSATAGLHLALEAFGLKPGQKVITTPFTFTASAEVIRYLGADPIFADIDPDTCNIQPESVQEILAQTPDVAMLLPVHYGGRACDMTALMDLAERYGLTVVEDAAHAFPASHRSKTVGQIGHATVFSFYVTKTLATGEGGMVVTPDEGRAARMRTMRLHGINNEIFDRYTASRPSWYYEVVAPGFKYNMSDMAAALGIHQLAKAETMRQRREWIAQRYTEAFQGLPFSCPPPANEGDLHAWHLYPIQLNVAELGIDRNTFIEKMCALGIGTSVHFIPLHQQPYWRDRYGLTPEMFPVAEAVYQRIVSLPIYPKMTNDDVNRVIEAVVTICGSRSDGNRDA